jgi:hypothetical protein
MESMTEATDSFVKKANWLGNADLAAVAALRLAAFALDSESKLNGTVLAQWYRIYNDLRNRKVEEQPEVDEQDEFLKGLG